LKPVLNILGIGGNLIYFYAVKLDMSVVQAGNSAWRMVWIIMYYSFF